MTVESDFAVAQLTADDLWRMRALMKVFGDAFADRETYGGDPPGAAYLRKLLASDDFVALVATVERDVVGGLAAYVLPKFERERSEVYLYDLAVAEAHRRKGVATALIGRLKKLAAERGAYVIFVQADRGDDAAIALYSKLGRREDVLHFDIPIARSDAAN